MAMRLGRATQRLGGGLLFAAAAAFTLAGGVVACAKGTETGAGFDEGGLAEEDAGRDVNVVPMPKDSAAPGDSGMPPDDSGGSCTQKVVINEVKTGGASNVNEEMIELYNPSTCAVPIGNWTLKYQSSGGSAPSARHTFASGDSIASKGYLVLTPGGSTDLAPGMAGGDGQVGLLDDTGKIIDAVAYGTVTAGMYREGTSAPSPASGGSIGRFPSGADSNNNKTDFKANGTPSPGIANP